MNQRLTQKLDSAMQDFTRSVAAIVEAAVQDALRGTASRAPTRRTTKGAKKSKKARAGRKPSKSVTEATLLKELAREGGRRMEQIAAALGTTSKALTPTMKALIENKQVKSKGKARGTTYRAA